MRTPTATFEPFGVVAVPFPYVERPVLKRRPALIVSAPVLAERHGLLWVAMITSAANPSWPDDVAIDDLQGANLRKPSVVRPAKLASAEAAAVEVIGRVSEGVAHRVRAVLGSYLAAGARSKPR
jgi:mRNA interferase MazF